MTGLQRLRNQDIKFGEERGIKLGTQKGIKLGKQEGKIQIAKNLLRQGVLIGIIQHATGLSTQELDKLKKEL